MKQIQYALTLLISFLFIGCTAYNYIPYPTIRLTHFLDEPQSDTLKHLSVNVKEYEEKYKGYDVVYQFYYSTMEQDIKPSYFTPNGLFSYYSLSKIHRHRYVVLNPDEEWVSTLTKTIPKDNRLVGLYSIVHLPDGTVKKYTMSDMKKTSTDNGTEYKIAYKNIVKGAIIEEGWHTIDEDFFDFEEYRLQLAQPVEHLHFEFALPSWMFVQIKKMGDSTILPIRNYIDAYDDITEYVYDERNIPGLKGEPFSPYYRERSPYFISKLEGMRHSYIRYKKSTWSDVDKNYKDLMYRDISRESKMNQLARQVTANCKTDVEKMDSIITWVQQNVTISSRNNNTNLSVQSAFDERGGSPFEITGVAWQMLSEVGINSSLVLLRDSRQGYFDSTFINMREFNNFALQAIIGGKSYVVFPAYPSIPSSLFPDEFQNYLALEIPKSDPYSFKKLSPANLGSSKTELNYAVKLNDEGLLQVIETRIYTGVDALPYRNKFKDLKGDELEKEMKNMVSYSDGVVKLKSHAIRNLNNNTTPLEVELQYTIDNLLTVTPDEIIFQTGGLFAPNSGEKSIFETDDRVNPVSIYSNDILNKTITLEFPKNWKLDTKVENSTDNNKFGEAKASYTIENGKINVQLQRQLTRTSQPKESYSDLLSLIGRKSKLNVSTLVFKR